MDDLAAGYVSLVLALGLHDTDYVDAYYGPPEWKTEAERERLSLAAIQDRADSLIARLDGIGDQRSRYVIRQLRSLIARADLLSGTRMSFDEESLALYGQIAPRHPESYFRQILAELDELLPGTGTAAERHAAFAAGYVVPPERLPEVFDIAIAECRRRTLDRIDLPAGESFDLEYVTGYSWGAQNWYQGDYRSRILVNTEVDLRVDRVLDLAGHEGYPGHHVAGLMIEQHLVRERGWLEYTVFPLHCPAAPILEGTAMLAVEVAFPGEERTAFERDAIYPAAGLDPSGAELYDRVRRLIERLGHAANEAARRYLDGPITADEAEKWLVDYMLMTPEQARLRLKFFDQYRSYIINYNVGLDAVRRQLPDDPDKRWEVFLDLLRSPATAVELAAPSPG